MRVKFYKFLKFLGRRTIFWLSLSIAAGLLNSLLELAISVQLQIFLRSLGVTQQEIILPGGFRPPMLPIATFGLLLVVIGTLKGISSFFIAQSAAVANELLNSRLKLMAFYEVLRLQNGFVSIAQMNYKIGELFPKATSFVYYSALLLPMGVHSLLLLVIMAFHDWVSTLIGLVGLFFVGIMVILINLKVKKASANVPKEFEVLSRGITRIMRNWFLLKALRTTDQEHLGLIRSSLAYSSHSIRACLLVNFAAVLPPIFGIALLSFIIIFHVHHPFSSTMNFLAFLYLFLRFVQMQATIANYGGNLTTLYPQFRSTIRFFFQFEAGDIYRAVEPAKLLHAGGSNLQQIHNDLDARKPAVSSKKAPQTIDNTPQVKAEGLGFTFESDSFLFRNLSFQLEKGQHLAVVGRSGTGKSTLLGILMGILKPLEGSITFDGVSPEEYFGKDERTLSYVGAEPFLIEGTIRENLVYGCRQPQSNEDLIAAMNAAHLGEWLSAHAQGLEYKLSENGEGLSTGQKQRLSLARALVHKPNFLILDEISANLDEATELEIVETIKKLKGICTTVIVSHRANLLKYADHRIELRR